MSQSLLSISSRPWRLSFESISSSFTGRDDVVADADTMTFAFEEWGSGVVVVPLFTYSWRAFIFAWGVDGIGTLGGKILLLFGGVCLDLFSVFVDSEDDWVFSSRFDRSNKERGTRIFVSDLDVLVVSASAAKKETDQCNSPQKQPSLISYPALPSFHQTTESHM